MLPECVCIPAGRRLWYRGNELDSRKGCRCSSTFYLGYGFTGQFHGRLASFQQARHVIRNSWVHVVQVVAGFFNLHAHAITGVCCIGKQLHSIPYFSILLYSVFRSMLSICAALLLLYLAFCSTSMISFRSCASLCSRRSGFSADGAAAVTSPDRLIA